MEDAGDTTIPPIFEDKNAFAQYNFSRGDINKCFENAKHIIEAEYSTGYQEQLYILLFKLTISSTLMIMPSIVSVLSFRLIMS